MSITTDPPRIVPLPDESSEHRLDVETVHSRSITGLKTLSLRAVLSVVLRIISAVTLSRLLLPGDYGLFGVASQISGIGVYLADSGMNGKLVHQVEEPTDDQSSTVFFLQQGSTTLFLCGVILFLPLLTAAYHMSKVEAGLVVAMTASLFFYSLRVVPYLLLERRLMYNKIAQSEAWEQVVSLVVNIAFALLGAGAWALALGNIARGAVGLVYIWRVGKWKPRGRFRPSLVLNMIRFGLPFQLNSLAPTLLSTVVMLYLPAVLGNRSFGLIGWAINISSIPLLFSTQLSRIAFPAFSRLQGDGDALQDSSLKVIRQLIFVLSPVVPMTIFLMPIAIIIVFGTKWVEAIPLVQWFTVDVGLQTITGLLAAMQNASGRPVERLIVAVFAGVLRIIATYYAVKMFGINGIGPTWVAVTLLELVITAVLVSRHNFGSLVLFPMLFLPLLETYLLTVAVIFHCQLLPSHTIYQQALQSLGMLALFCIFLGVKDSLTPGRPLISAVQYLVGIIGRFGRRQIS